MTTAGIPESPVIEALRHALAAWNDWHPRAGDDIGRAEAHALAEAAHAVVSEFDVTRAYITALAIVPRPSPEQVREQLNLPPRANPNWVQLETLDP